MKPNKTALSFLLIVVLVASVIGVTPRPAHAAGIPYVLVVAGDDNNPNAECSLRKAIVAINTQNFMQYPKCVMDATTTAILLPDSPIILTVQNVYDAQENTIIDNQATGDLDIMKNITIRGTGSKSAVVWGIGTQNATEDRVFHIYPGATAVMANFTISLGTAPMADSKFPDGGGILNEGNLSLAHMTLSGNYANGAGGAIDSKQGASLSVVASLITGNKAFVSGGGIMNESTGQIQTSTFEGNTTEFGQKQGAAFFNGAPINKLVQVNSSTFTNNIGNVVENSGALALNFVTIYGNNTAQNSYGIFLNNNSWTMMRGSVLAKSTSSNLIGKDCYRITSGVKFVDGGYNLVSPAPDGTDPQVCPYSLGAPYTQIINDLILTYDPVLNIFTFTPDQQLPVYDGIPASGGVCLFPNIPVTDVPAGITIPPAPNYDQQGRLRPDSDPNKPSQSCDIGSFEFGAGLPFTSLPSVFRAP